MPEHADVFTGRLRAGGAMANRSLADLDLVIPGLAAGAQVRYAIVDRVAEAILDEATRFGADLIVLGPPRRRELAARAFGSVTKRVIQRSTCPVIVTPRAPRGSRPTFPALARKHS
jgi:nucleotide-binding universal stress UspA family protein